MSIPENKAQCNYHHDTTSYIIDTTSCSVRPCTVSLVSSEVGVTVGVVDVSTVDVTVCAVV